MKKRTIKRIVAMALVLCTLFACAIPSSAASHKFTDVKDTDWFGPAVEYCYKNGVMSGESTTKFNPHGKLKREDIAVIIGKIWDLDKGKDEKTNVKIKYANAPKPFDDVNNKSSYYYPYVAFLRHNRITSGISSNLYGVGQNVTRKDFCMFLDQYCQNIKEMKYVYIIPRKGKTPPFKDIGSLTGLQLIAVVRCWQIGVVSGYSDNTFKPNEAITRAEAAQMIMTFCKSQRLNNFKP